MLFSVMAVLGCAEPTGDPVTLRWYSVDAECVDGTASWSTSEDVVALSVRRSEREALVYYGGGTLAEDGTLSVTCTDDVHILYALEE
jgi:hypothetical protein